MNNNLLIIGAGGHGRVVKEDAVAMGCFDKIDFLDDNSSIAIDKFDSYKKYINDYKYAFVALGDNQLRMEWLNRLSEAGYMLPVLLHHTAYVSRSAKISEGCYIGAKAVVNINSVIGTGCILGIGALVDHDAYIGEYSYINAGAIVTAGSKVERLARVEAGKVYGNDG